MHKQATTFILAHPSFSPACVCNSESPALHEATIVLFSTFNMVGPYNGPAHMLILAILMILLAIQRLDPRRYKRLLTRCATLLQPLSLRPSALISKTMDNKNLVSFKIIKDVVSQLKPISLNANEFFRHTLRLNSPLGLSERVGINVDTLGPGTRTSVGHAHSHDDEFVYVLSGRGLLWVDGYTYEVGPNDYVGLSAGTGVAHTFISNGNTLGSGDDRKDDELVLLIFGENGEADRVYHPYLDEESPSFVVRLYHSLL